MRYCFTVLFALAALGHLSCGGGEDINLTSEIPCDEEEPCPTGFSCRVNKCVEYFSLGEDETCTVTVQCREDLVCREFICEAGCTDLWYLDDCQDRTWCKPLLDQVITTDQGDLAAGDCAPSECNPSVSDLCSDGSACVAIAADVGACLPYCEYGFDLDGYFDTCEDVDGVDHACQPMGITAIPVCFPAGGENAPVTGLPGCDAVRNPCIPGSVCYGVVCRELCSGAQLNPCNPGEICSSVGQRADLAFCLAD